MYVLPTIRPFVHPPNYHLFLAPGVNSIIGDAAGNVNARFLFAFWLLHTAGGFSHFAKPAQFANMVYGTFEWRGSFHGS
jgi:hypothetical protein